MRRSDNIYDFKEKKTGFKPTGRKKSSSKFWNPVARKYECDKCDKKYVNYRNLQRHKKFECNDKPPQFSCKFCAYKSRHNHNVFRHECTVHSDLIT